MILTANKYIGRKFAKLTICSVSGTDQRFRYARVNCKCDCGKEVVRKLYCLSRGSSKSCGCQRIEKNSLPVRDAVLNNWYAKYRYTAKKRKIPFELDYNDFTQMAIQECHYCGRQPKTRVVYHVAKLQNYDFFVNGIDRKDNNVGYIKYNCVPCCKTCNTMKSNMSYEEFKDWIRTVHQRICN